MSLQYKYHSHLKVTRKTLVANLAFKALELYDKG
jgi:hypothetical protein